MKSSVLIVEDEPTVRKVMTELLEDSELQAIEAESASEALKTLRHGGVDISVLVTDVMMPGQLSGLDLAKMARNSWPWIKIIVTSAFPDAIAGKLPAGVRFLPKPWAVDEMLGYIRSASSEFQNVQAAGSVH